MRYLLILAVCFASLAQAQDTSLSITPQPVQVVRGKGQFTLNKRTVLAARDDADRRTAELFNDYLQQYYGFKLDIDRQESRNAIRFTTRNFIKAPDKDGYSLTVGKDEISIEGDTHAGTFYGMQTLVQLLPLPKGSIKTAALNIPFVAVTDYPRFSYRGMHLDVARHFFPTSFVKRYIDYLALHKMNFFHWHLTDDQGWRIEIKRYPELTRAGAWRDGTIVGRYPGSANDNQRYGGFYTQEEVREIVRYAADRHITVIPEIEMPGHSSAAIAAYPWLSCFPDEETVIPTHPSLGSQQKKGKKVQETWGVFQDVYCAGKDSTFTFLQNVIDEILPLFPSTYIHAGGDESPKANWKRCPHCQARIKALGLKDEHELQSYFIQRMEKHLNSKGRTLVGWDEILEGGLAPNAVVMSWRGEKGGIEAATLNHQVIMTPQKPVYFDHSQTRNEDSIVIGGHNPLEQVYAYEPVPKDLPADKAIYIIGAQANLWTEYIKYPSKVEYMIFPRLSALSEVLWSGREQRNWSRFEKKLPQIFQRYDLWQNQYSKAYYDIAINLSPAPGGNGVLVSIVPRDKNGVITYAGRYDKAAARYSKPFTYTTSGPLSIRYERGGKRVSEVVMNFNMNKATGKKISISSKPNERWPGQGGAFGLVNGLYSTKGLSSTDWMGWIGQDVIATIDLGSVQSLDSVRVHSQDQPGSWIYLPQSVEVLLSNDGQNFTSTGSTNQFIPDMMFSGWFTVAMPQKKARYIKVVAKNAGVIPEGKPGSGTKAWLFLDEIQAY